MSEYRLVHIDYGKRCQFWLRDKDDERLSIYIDGEDTDTELTRADAMLVGLSLLGWAVDGRDWRGPFLDDDTGPEEGW